MERTYKLAANFNTVEFKVTDYDLMGALDWDTEVVFDENDEPTWDIEDEVLIARILQREYDLLASIEVVNVAPPAKTVKQTEKKEKEFEPASEKQIKWAKNLGMKNPEKASKQEVRKYIQDHKDDDN